jgi:hypothetical protein
MNTRLLDHVKDWMQDHRITKKQRSSGSASITLDEDSVILLERLKAKIPAFGDGELISSALKCLEQKTDMIIKKHVMRRIKTLKREGLNSQEIARDLNEGAVPPFGDHERWQSDTISSLLDKTEKTDAAGTVVEGQ